MKVKNSDLKNALAIVKPGLAKKELITQTTSFAFFNDKVVTYNDTVSVSHPLKDLNITGAVKAEELYQLLTKLDDDAEIDITLVNNQLILRHKKMRASFVFQEKIKIPFDPNINEKGYWTEIPEGFIHFLKMASGVCSQSKEVLEQKLTTIYVNGQYGTIEATDQRRMIRCSLKKSMPIEPFLLPFTAVEVIESINPVEISKGKGWIHFKNGEGTIVSSRIYYEDFFDTANALKIENGLSVVFPDNILQIIEKAEVFSKRRESIEERIAIEINDGKIKVSSESPSGRFMETSSIDYSGKPFSFEIIPYLIRDIFKETRTCIVGERKLKFEGDGWTYISVFAVKPKEEKNE